MNLTRVKLLEQYAREDPADPFPLYALALEYVQNNSRKAKELFDSLLANHPDYTPVYYHAAVLYIAANDLMKAKHILATGIRKTAEAGDRKANAELHGLYDNMEE